MIKGRQSERLLGDFEVIWRPSSSSSCRGASADIPDPLLPLLPIVHRLWPSQSCCMCVRAGCPAFVRPYVVVHRSTSLMSSSRLLQQCPACLVRGHSWNQRLFLWRDWTSSSSSYFHLILADICDKGRCQN